MKKETRTELHEDRRCTNIRAADLSPDMLGEPFPACSSKKQGEYTLEDYYALPEDKRFELIDGVLYEMAAPIAAHQRMELLIAMELEKMVDENKGDCETFVSPLDVQLDCDDRTMVQPDIVVLCRPEEIHGHSIYGVPDFVIEILSPSTREKDSTIKKRKYEAAGVREYWIVDMENRAVTVYRFEQTPLPRYYTFEDRIPVGIRQDRIELDFSVIWGKIKNRFDI